MSDMSDDAREVEVSWKRCVDKEYDFCSRALHRGEEAEFHCNTTYAINASRLPAERLLQYPHSSFKTHRDRCALSDSSPSTTSFRKGSDVHTFRMRESIVWAMSVLSDEGMMSSMGWGSTASRKKIKRYSLWMRERNDASSSDIVLRK